MTPFDPLAILAMLLAFYPVVGPGALERAVRERPEYFAGGRLVGTGRDKVQFPDGRIWDFIFNVNGPDQRWIAIDALAGSGGSPAVDPFALEAGPLTPIDESAFVFVPPAPVFTPLVAGALGELGPVDEVLNGAANSATEGSVPGDLDAALTGALGEAGGALDGALGAAGAFVPDDVLGHTHGQGSSVPGRIADYTEAIPPEEYPVPEPPSGGPWRDPDTG